MQIGDLVLQIDLKHKRAQWKMAVVINTYPGEDGLVRKVRIKSQTGEYDRPIHKLCLIATHDELINNELSKQFFTRFQDIFFAFYVTV